jgi:tetratricopeptide (TPR) repeat protein
MPIDRDATLKKAEKLLRQGKLDGAIAEYVRLIEDQPKDWSSINALGDLYIRAAQPDKAVAQFTRIADHLFSEGFYPKAAALYKKVVKIKTDDEHTLLRLAEIAAKQGVLVDAKTYYRQVAEARRGRKDQRGWAEMIIRVGTLDPGDADSKITAARAAQEIDDIPRAVALLQGAADAFEKQKKEADALAALAEALGLDPSDAALRARLLNGLIGQGKIDQAKEVARTSEELIAIAELLENAGRKGEALEVYTEAAQLDPSNVQLRTRLARECLAAGNPEQARRFLNAETAGDDPELLMALARLELQGGRLDEGRVALGRLLSAQPARRDELVFVACELADQKFVDAAFMCVDMVADAALLDEDWPAAAAALHEYVTRVPNQIPALMKLVEICVDGGLESTMYMAQAQLADAYLASGLGAEARVIAEDLVAREPWVRANIDRFRRALLLLGVADPDAVIAERLSGDTPFLSTYGAAMDLGLPGSDLPSATPVAESEAEPPAEPASQSLEETISFEETLEFDLPPIPSAAVDKPGPIVSEPKEVDLSDALRGIKPAPPAPSSPAPDIDTVLAELRAKAARQSQTANATEQYAAGVEHLKHGRIDEAINSLEAASRVPMMRFLAGSQLGRLHISRGDLADGVEWLERAAQAPAPTPEEGYAVMYELADSLEQLGESARALAVLMELEADTGGYRDVQTRIDRLARVQTGG